MFKKDINKENDGEDLIEDVIDWNDVEKAFQGWMEHFQESIQNQKANCWTCQRQDWSYQGHGYPYDIWALQVWLCRRIHFGQDLVLHKYFSSVQQVICSMLVYVLTFEYVALHTKCILKLKSFHDNKGLNTTNSLRSENDILATFLFVISIIQIELKLLNSWFTKSMNLNT